MLKVWTVRSAASLEDRWYAAIVKCLRLFNSHKLLNSWLKKNGLLSSLLRKYGVPLNAKLQIIIAADFIFLIRIASIQFEKESQTIKKQLSKKRTSKINVNSYPRWCGVFLRVNQSFFGHCVMNLACITCFQCYFNCFVHTWPPYVLMSFHSHNVWMVVVINRAIWHTLIRSQAKKRTIVYYSL